MDLKNKSIEPVTDLGLSLRYSNQWTDRILHNNIGAGANAASKIDMKFLARDSLSELVWSPRNGLGLKCADRSFPDNKASNLWDVGPSNAVSSPGLAEKRVVVNFLTHNDELKDDEQIELRSKDPDRTTSFPPQEKLESTDENDSDTLISDGACGGATKILESEFSRGVKRIPRKAEEIVPSDMHQRKGKRKALPDGDVQDDSNESAESCNSGGLVSTSKKQCSFQRQSIGGSKQVKKDIQGSPNSRSYIRQDSSFVNWISNIMTGFTKSNEDVAPSLALTLAGPNQANESPEKKLITVPKGRDIGLRNGGFQSIFRSIYCSETKVNETRNMASPICDTGATPIACYRVPDTFCKQLAPSNFDEAVSTNGAGPSKKVQSLSLKCPVVQQSSKANSADKEKDRTSSNSSMDECRMNSTKKSDSIRPSKLKASDPSESLWISRFCPKNVGNLRTEAKEHSPQKALVASGNENRNCATKAEPSISFNRIRGHMPLQKFKGSKVMAFDFARRLAALKHVLLLDKTDNAGPAYATCFFCGKIGHHLRECPDITESEVEDIMRTINSNDGAKQLPCLCIRCFQLDHWPVACPNALAREQHELDGGTSLVHPCAASKMHLNTGIERNSKRCICASSEKDVGETQIAPLCNVVSKQSSNIPKGIFDAVRRLRLARTDILKWMNSHRSLSHLNGLFLRLRLRKLEEGLGKTGYSVAFITEAESERSTRITKSSISVKVEGITFFVESQFVSNHDFLEDELMAWWYENSNNGCSIPTLEDLQAKFKEREMLGL